MTTAPNLQLCFYNHAVILTRRNGGRWTSYPVDPGAVASVIGQLPTSTGLLPPNTLATGQRSGVPFYVLYVPARTARIQVQDGAEVHLWSIPTPPLIWAGCGDDYRLWATRETSAPTNSGIPLYNAPFPNLYPGGRICWGDSERRPQATAHTILTVLDLFLTGSRFNSHLATKKSQFAAGNVLGMLQTLDGADAYPLDDLVFAAENLQHVLGGGE